jgi:hypothetical protein
MPLYSRIRNAGGFKTIEPLEERERFLGCRAVLDGRPQESSCRAGITSLKGSSARVNQFLTFALTLGNRAAGSLNVRARPSMAAVDEQGTRPNVNGEFVLASKVVIKSAQQQLFETCFAILLRFESG